MKLPIKKLLRYISAAAGALALNTATLPIALSESGQLQGLDVILIMDSSGSMKKTDPDDLRKPAAKLFISLLGKEDRASVVSFSDSGYPVAFLTPVDGDKNKQLLYAAVDKISTKGWATNLHGALESAERVFKRDPQENRKKVVVLMTDGKMDLADDKKTAELRQTLVDELLPKLKQQDILVNTVAFTDNSQKDFLKNIADITGGRFTVAKTDKDLHTTYTALFEHDKSPNVLPFNGEEFEIDPSIKEVTIVGSKETPDVVLSLMTPKGEQLTAREKPANISWYESQQFDLITIPKPEKGAWQIKSSDGKNKAYIITDLQLHIAVEPKSPKINEGLYIYGWLEDKSKTIDKVSVLSTLQVELLVTTPEGETHTLAMDPETSSQDETLPSGRYYSYIALPTSGDYNIKIITTSTTFKRERNSTLKVQPPASVDEPIAHDTSAEQVNVQDMQSQAQPEVTATDSHNTTHTDINVEKPIVEPPAIEPVAQNEPGNQAAHVEAQPQEQQPPAQTSSQKDKDKKAEKPKKEKEKEKAKEKDKEQDAKNENEADGSSGILTAIYIFLAINGLLLVVGGIVFVIMKRKSKKPANGDADEGKDAPDAGDNKKDKAA